MSWLPQMPRINNSVRISGFTFRAIAVFLSSSVVVLTTNTCPNSRYRAKTEWLYVIQQKLICRWIYEWYIWTAVKEAKTWLIIAVIYRFKAAVKLKPVMTSAIPVQCSTNWAIKPTGSFAVDGEECKWIYEISYIWTAEEEMKTWLIIAVIYTT